MRAKPKTVCCRLTDEKKKAFYNKCLELGKPPQKVLESYIDKLLFGNDSS